ncbi:MAG TPA: trigger factor, partial [Rhizomicrobium sp.]
MQITETVSEGLRREYTIVIAADDLEARLTGRIEEMKPRLHLKGFRPGKAPLSYLRKTFGKSLMGEIVEQAVSETSQKTVAERELKPAFPPRVDVVSQMQQVVEGKSDLEFTVKVDLMPEFELADVSKLEVETLVADITDADHDDALQRVAEQARTYSARGEDEAAENKDSVRIDFVGRVDGQEFTGGKAEDLNLVLGSGQFLPGFEDRLIGARSGDEREVKITFPGDYPQANLAG